MYTWGIVGVVSLKANVTHPSSFAQSCASYPLIRLPMKHLMCLRQVNAWIDELTLMYTCVS